MVKASTTNHGKSQCANYHQGMAWASLQKQQFQGIAVPEFLPQSITGLTNSGLQTLESKGARKSFLSYNVEAA